MDASSTTPHREALRREIELLYSAAGSPRVQAVCDRANAIRPPSTSAISRQRIHEWVISRSVVPADPQRFLAVIDALTEEVERKSARAGGAHGTRRLPASHWIELHRRAYEESRAPKSASQPSATEPEPPVSDLGNEHVRPATSVALSDSPAPSRIEPRSHRHKVSYARLAVVVTALLAVTTLVALTVYPALVAPNPPQGQATPLGSTSSPTSTPTVTSTSKSTSTPPPLPDTATILSPANNSSAPHNLTVAGQAAIATGRSLWLILRPTSGDGFYVTSLKPVSVSANGTFTSSVGVGRGSCDIGRRYEVFAISAPSNGIIARRLRANPTKYVSLDALPSDVRRVGSSAIVTLRSFKGAPDACPPPPPRPDPPNNRGGRPDPVRPGGGDNSPSPNDTRGSGEPTYVDEPPIEPDPGAYPTTD